MNISMSSDKSMALACLVIALIYLGLFVLFFSAFSTGIHATPEGIPLEVVTLFGGIIFMASAVAMGLKNRIIIILSILSPLWGGFLSASFYIAQSLAQHPATAYSAGYSTTSEILGAWLMTYFFYFLSFITVIPLLFNVFLYLVFKRMVRILSGSNQDPNNDPVTVEESLK